MLKEKGILVTELIDKRNDLRKQWEEAFTKQITKSQKRKINFHQHLWHVFSFSKLPCLTEQKARDAFDKNQKDACYIFYQDNEYVLLLENAKWIKAEDIINGIHGNINDVYVVDKDFSWSYILTHEYFCGPYFHQIEI